MTQVLATAREASGVAERDRVAWNLPPPRAGAPSQATLDWYGFLARYFPGRRRHDFKALTAYHAYRSLGVTPCSEAAAPDNAEPESSAVTTQDAWEDDGGATLAESRFPKARGGVLAVSS